MFRERAARAPATSAEHASTRGASGAPKAMRSTRRAGPRQASPPEPGEGVNLPRAAGAARSSPTGPVGPGSSREDGASLDAAAGNAAPSIPTTGPAPSEHRSPAGEAASEPRAPSLSLIPQSRIRTTGEMEYHDCVRELLAEVLADAEAKAKAPEVQPDSGALARPRFALDTDRKVEWFVRLMGDLHAARARIRAQAKAIERDLTRDLAGLADRFAVPLEDWLDRKIRVGRGRPKKSVKTLEGDVGRGVQPHGPHVVNKAAATAWAEAHEEDNSAPVWGEIRYILDPKKFLADLKETGEVADGIEYREKKDGLYVAYRDQDGHKHRVSFPALGKQLAALRGFEDEDAIELEEEIDQ